MRFWELFIYHLVWEGGLIVSWKTGYLQMNLVGTNFSIELMSGVVV